MRMGLRGDPPVVSTDEQAEAAEQGWRLPLARAAAWVTFGVTGLVAASWAARIPAVQDRLGLSTGGLAVAVLGIEGGALLGLPLGGALVARWGSRHGVRAGFAVYAPGLLAVAFAPSLGWLTAGLAAWAAANSVVDVALNAQGVELERRYRRPVLSGLHAAQGIGLLLGAAGATAAAAASLSLVVHFGLVAAVALVVGLAATWLLVQETRAPRPRAGEGRRTRPRGPLLLLGVVAFCAFLIDGAATNWIAVQLRTDHGAGPGLAAAGYLVFTAALVAARLAGDRLSARYSRTRIATTCGLLTAAGTAAAVLAPTAPLALAGWGLVGLAVALLAPTVLSAAPAAARAGSGASRRALSELPAPMAIATVTTIGYLGSFTGPPLIGALAEVTDLSVALSVIAVAGIGVALLAHRLPPAPRRPRTGGDAVRRTIPFRRSAYRTNSVTRGRHWSGARHP
jgi:MFS family permease